MVNKDSWNEINYTISNVFSHLLNLLNPFLPFVTEEISKNLNFTDEYNLSLKKITILSKKELMFYQYKNFEKLKNLVTTIRNLKQKENLKPIELLVINKNKLPKWIDDNKIIIKSFFGINTITTRNQILLKEKNNYKIFVISGIRFGIKSETLSKNNNNNKNEDKISFYKKEIVFFEKKLSNRLFLKNAPKKIIDEQKKKLLKAKKNLSLLLK